MRAINKPVTINNFQSVRGIALDEMAAIMDLLCVLCTEFHEMKLINQLNNFYNFDHNIYLLNPSTDMNLFLNAKRGSDLTPYSSYVFQSVDDEITGLERMIAPTRRRYLFVLEHELNRTAESKSVMKTKNLFMIVTPESGEFENNFNLFKKVKEMQTLKLRMKIGLFFYHFVSSDNLKKLFEWFWNRRIINVFAATFVVDKFSEKRLFNLFTFNPFGRFNVIDITDNFSLNKLFLSVETNFQQHPIKMGHTFKESYDKKLWLAIFNVMNCSFTISDRLYSNSTESLENKIYVFPQLFEQINPWDLNVYPMKYEWKVLVVPAAVPYPDFSAYLRTMTSNIFFTYSSITVIGAMFLLIIIRYVSHKKLQLFQSVADILNLLMNDNGAIKYPMLTTIEACLLVPLTFVGLIFVNGILSSLQKHLIRPILQPQIDTIEDVYSSSIIITTDREFYVKEITEIFETKHPDVWTNRFAVMETTNFTEKRDTFALISFPEGMYTSNVLLKSQKRLDIKRYHISKLFLKKYIHSYGVNDEFPFTDRINEILHWVRCSGLYEKWLEEYFNAIEDEIVEKNRVIFEHGKSKVNVVIEPVSIPIFIVYGWCMAAVVLVIEIIWKRLETLVKRIRLKKLTLK